MTSKKKKNKQIILQYRTVYVSDGRIRSYDAYTAQGFTDSLKGAIRCTASRLAVEQFPKAFIVDRITQEIVVTLVNTKMGITIHRNY
jgi:hypothetical protein